MLTKVAVTATIRLLKTAIICIERLPKNIRNENITTYFLLFILYAEKKDGVSSETWKPNLIFVGVFVG